MFLNGTTSGKTCGCPGPGGQNIIFIHEFFSLIKFLFILVKPPVCANLLAGLSIPVVYIILY